MRYPVRTSFSWAILTKVDQGSRIHLVSVVDMLLVMPRSGGSGFSVLGEDGEKDGSSS